MKARKPEVFNFLSIQREDSSCLHFMARKTKGKVLHVGQGLVRTEPMPGFLMYTPTCFLHTCVSPIQLP